MPNTVMNWRDPINWRDAILKFEPCGEALPWLNAQPSPEEAWNTCVRGDWMLWAAAKLGVDKRLVVKAAALCAKEALIYVPKGEHRPRIAIEAALRWCDDNADAAYTADAAVYVVAAASSAYADAAAASSAYAAVFDYAAASSAYAAAVACVAAAYAAANADAACAAASAAAACAAAAYAAAAVACVAADSNVVRLASLCKAADIVRSTIPFGAVCLKEIVQNDGKREATG